MSWEFLFGMMVEMSRLITLLWSFTLLLYIFVMGFISLPEFRLFYGFARFTTSQL